MIIFTIRTSTNIYSLLIEYFSQTPYNRIIQIHIKLRRHNSFIFARFLINVSNLAGRERRTLQGLQVPKSYLEDL